MRSPTTGIVVFACQDDMVIRGGVEIQEGKEASLAYLALEKMRELAN